MTRIESWLAELAEQAAQEGKAYKVPFFLSLAVNAILAAVALMKRK